mgnify:FL=1
MIIKFPDFRKALDFVNKVGEIAKEQGHHRLIGLRYRQEIPLIEQPRDISTFFIRIQFGFPFPLVLIFQRKGTTF